jgi:glutaredoxin
MPNQNTGMFRITIFSRPGCHLCEQVEQLISKTARRRKDMQIEIRNICEDPGEFELYQFDVPVIFLNNREIARHRLTEEQLETALKGK